jgi:hypothetical protein
VLLWYLKQGWTLDAVGTVEIYALGGQRHTAIYSFTLRRADVAITMPVLANPAVLHVIEKYCLTVRLLNGRRRIAVEFHEEILRIGSTSPQWAGTVSLKKRVQHV